MKMDQRMIIVCSAVGSLGLLSAILGFSAEGTKLTLSDIEEIGRACHHPQNPAAGLGACAAILLVIAQITFAAVGWCCKSRAIPSGTNRTIGVACAVSSWILAIIAFGLLVGGAEANIPGDHGGYCKEPMGGLFAGGAVLTFVATALGITSYVMLRTQPAATAAPKEGEKMPAGAAGISMEQPQFSQQASPQGQGYGQAPPNYPQYCPPPQGQQGYGQAPNAQFPAVAAAASPLYGQAPNPHYPPPPAQGYATNHHHLQQQQFPHPPAQGYGAQAPNQQYPPPAHGYGAQAPEQQYPPPAHGYGAQAPEQQFTLASPPPAQFYGGPAHTPNQQAPPPPKGDEQV